MVPTATTDTGARPLVLPVAGPATDAGFVPGQWLQPGLRDAATLAEFGLLDPNETFTVSIHGRGSHATLHAPRCEHQWLPSEVSSRSLTAADLGEFEDTARAPFGACLHRSFLLDDIEEVAGDGPQLLLHADLDPGLLTWHRAARRATRDAASLLELAAAPETAEADATEAVGLQLCAALAVLRTYLRQDPQQHQAPAGPDALFPTAGRRVGMVELEAWLVASPVYQDQVRARVDAGADKVARLRAFEDRPAAGNVIPSRFVRQLLAVTEDLDPEKGSIWFVPASRDVWQGWAEDWFQAPGAGVPVVAKGHPALLFDGDSLQPDCWALCADRGHSGAEVAEALAVSGQAQPENLDALLEALAAARS